MTQTRTCTNPAPANGGNDCPTTPVGDTQTGIACNEQTCIYSCTDTPDRETDDKKYYYDVRIYTYLAISIWTLCNKLCPKFKSTGPPSTFAEGEQMCTSWSMSLASFATQSELDAIAEIHGIAITFFKAQTLVYAACTDIEKIRREFSRQGSLAAALSSPHWKKPLAAAPATTRQAAPALWRLEAPPSGQWSPPSSPISMWMPPWTVLEFTPPTRRTGRALLQATPFACAKKVRFLTNIT